MTLSILGMIIIPYFIQVHFLPTSKDHLSNFKYYQGQLLPSQFMQLSEAQNFQRARKVCNTYKCCSEVEKPSQNNVEVVQGLAPTPRSFFF